MVASARRHSKGRVLRKTQAVLPVKAAEQSRGRSDEVAFLRGQLSHLESLMDRSRWNCGVHQSQMHGELTELRGSLIEAEKHALLSATHLKERGEGRMLCTERKAMENMHRPRAETMKEQDEVAHAAKANDQVVEQREQLRRQLQV